MKRLNLGTALAVLALLAWMSSSAPAAQGDGVTPSITPALVEEIIFPGGSVDIEKTVQTPEIPPKPDIYFLSDTTGSMDPAIAAVMANADAVLAAISGSDPNALFGVGEYRDFPYDPEAYANLAPIDGAAAASLAIGTWVASGGADGSEAQFYALSRIADPADPEGIGFRADSSKIIVWFGDCPGHDPVPAAASTAVDPVPADMTEATTTAALVAGGFHVVAISTGTGCTGGLDADPVPYGGDYAAAYGIVEDGTPGQASRIAAATGGVHLVAATPDEVVAAILAGIAAISVEVEMVSDCTAPISVSFAPAIQTVVSGDPAVFIETISVAADAPGGTYECDDWALIDGEPMRDAAGNIIKEHKIIKVPEGFLTGGGQIDNGKGKNAEKISFGGNVGFLADFSLVGQWQTNLHNVGVDSLDKARFHSTAITALQFFHDGGAGPNPPPANANVGKFTATGRLNGVDGYTLDVCLADRGEPGRQNDSIRFRLTDPAGVVVYDSLSEFVPQDLAIDCHNHLLDAGNLQIHSGLKGP